MSDKKGYRVFYNTETCRFDYDVQESEARDYKEGSTEFWFSDVFAAGHGADERNNRIDAGRLTVKICKDCHTPFTFYKEEADWFEAAKLTPPARCKTCREKRKFEKSYKRSSS